MSNHAACNESAAYNQSYVWTLWKIQAEYYEIGYLQFNIVMEALYSLLCHKPDFSPFN